MNFKSCFDPIEADFWLERHLVTLEGLFGQNLLPTQVRRIGPSPPRLHHSTPQSKVPR